MLYRDRNSQEGYIHICDDAHKYNRKYIAERPRIYVHDCRVYMHFDRAFLDIDFCPYCGKKIEEEIETATNEYYKF